LQGKVIVKGKRLLGDEDEEYSDSGTDSDTEPNVCAELSDITYFFSHHMKTFEESLNLPPFHMHSFVENKANKYARDLRDKWISFNRTHLSRIYPGGLRLDSSNYNPMISWFAGSQLVALNFQIPDEHMRLNDGRFRENGGCGYVPKPQSLNTDNPQPSQVLTIKIKVLGGSCLPKAKGKKTGERIDPYVDLCLFDVDTYSGKEIKQSRKTQSVNNNGFNPVWKSSQPFMEYVVHNPEIAILQLNVFNQKQILGGEDSFIASASVPVSCIRQGYRSVKLFDERNMRNGLFDCATLLVEVKIENGDTITPVLPASDNKADQQR